MRPSAVLLVGFALIGISTETLVLAGATRASEQDSISSGVTEQCRVEVTRTADEGVFNVTRGVFNGKCTCYVSTGPTSQGGSAEASVAAILRDRSCVGSPPAIVEAAAGAVAGGNLLPLLGLAAAPAGVVAATGSSSP